MQFMYKGEALNEPGNVDFGSEDISGIGDGTVTGAIKALNSKTTASSEIIGEKITLTRMGNMRHLYIDNIDASIVHSTKIPANDIPKSVIFGQMQYWDVSTYSPGLISVDTDGNMGAIAKNSSYDETLGGVRGTLIWFL